jgi:hypothetical protein
MVFQNDILAGAAGAGGGYTIDQSIRFDRATSSALYRTQGTPDGTSWTLSFWMKRGQLRNGSGEEWFINGGAAYPDYIRFETSDKIRFRIFSRSIDNTTTAVFRDPGAWYHFVANWNGSTGAYNLWQNNVSLISGTGSAGETYYNKSGQLFNIGRDGGGSNYFDGYFAEVVKQDNIVSDPTAFGEYNDDGVWVPIDVSGLSFGSEGFYIKGQDSSNLGDDSSGNGNDFTSSGLTASDQVLDSPTDNYCVISPLTGVNAGSSVVTQANGNLEATMTANYVGTFGTVAANSGKYYFEYSYAADGNYNDGRLSGGVVCVETADHGHFRIDGGSFYVPDRTTEGNYMIHHLNGSGQLSNTGTSRIAYNTSLSSASATGGPESGPDIYMVALDLDNNNIYWGKNGTWYGSGGTSGSAYTDATPAGILSTHQGKYFAPAFWFNGATSGTTTVLNCGQDATFGGRYSSPAGDFYYTPPIGFSALSTANLPEPAIADGSAYFQTTTYTGAGYPTEVNQLGNSTFQPDFVWVKRRNGATTHDLFDAVRGVSSQLYSNLTNAEGTVSNAISFDADGFTAAADPITGDTGSSGNTFVGWQWLAANGTASNTDGSITSTVSANVAAGFSVIGWTGNGTSGATIGHGLSAAPELFIVKNRSNSDFWAILETVYYGATHYLTLPSTSGSNSNSTFWTNTNPTSSVITLGTQNRSNGSGDSMIGYAWHSVEGFSKIGSYTGNGSTDGPFIFTGFRPAFVIFKKINGTDSWEMFDSTRPGYNVTNLGLLPNTTNSEITGRNIDILSNGIKQRNANGTTNENGNTYIYIAFAENPFGGDGVAPVPAR